MNFILIMHTPLAQAMHDVLKHVMPELCNELYQSNSLKIIDICPHSCLLQQQQTIHDYINHTEGFILCLNDLFGATPYRLMNESIENFRKLFPEKMHKVHGLTGVNIPVFLRAIKSNESVKKEDTLFSWPCFIKEITKNNACII